MFKEPNAHCPDSGAGISNRREKGKPRTCEDQDCVDIAAEFLLNAASALTHLREHVTTYDSKDVRWDLLGLSVHEITKGAVALGLAKFLPACAHRPRRESVGIGDGCYETCDR